MRIPKQIANLKHAVDSGSHRFATEGILIDRSEPSEVSAVAMTSHMMSKLTWDEARNGEGGWTGAILPVASLSPIGKPTVMRANLITANKDSVSIEVFDRKAGQSQLSITPIEGIYPRYRDAIRSDSGNVVRLNIKLLKALLATLENSTDDEFYGIDIDVGDKIGDDQVKIRVVKPAEGLVSATAVIMPLNKDCT